MKRTQYVTVRNENGFHLRAASLLSNRAAQFKERITLTKGEHVADCKSCFDLLELLSPCGTILELTVEGKDSKRILPILEKHPEFRHRNLLDYGNPEALAWIQKTVYDIIALHKIDVYREDFNMDPRGIWVEMDAADPDRVGIGEARHITGLYQFLDQMRERFPGILQENCSSGGRRFDIEMAKRAHGYCRSDYFIGPKPGDTAFVLGQNATLNTIPYLPFQGGESNCVAIGDDYGMMSVVSSGTVFTPTDLDGGIVKRPISDDETAWLKKVYDIAARMNKLYLGDFYPLTDETPVDNNVWCAWQVDKSDENAGFALAFRRADAPDESQTFALGNIDAAARYDVEFFDGSKKTVSGAELANWEVKLAPRSFQLVFYQKLAEQLTYWVTWGN